MDVSIFHVSKLKSCSISKPDCSITPISPAEVKAVLFEPIGAVPAHFQGDEKLTSSPSSCTAQKHGHQVPHWLPGLMALTSKLSGGLKASHGAGVSPNRPFERKLSSSQHLPELQWDECAAIATSFACLRNIQHTPSWTQIPSKPSETA